MLLEPESFLVEVDFIIELKRVLYCYNVIIYFYS
jgi:hypothetical protein